ncbi:hypothetical protein ACIHFE_34105 [Streptomyces sp. NPDC052396]|uniref:hypothetical protein n=1 Tax=Streptomyces sp. NPDC052396 TaxID=3365689 RepID=UPI0037CE95E9
MELETLTTFKAGIDEVLKTLQGKDAPSTSFADSHLVADNLGNGFEEVGELHGAYAAVQGDLVALSKLLHDQIEALELATHSAHNGYVDTDQAQRDQMWAVQKDLMQHYVPPKSGPYAPYPTQPTTESKGKPNDTSVAT